MQKDMRKLLFQHVKRTSNMGNYKRISVRFNLDRLEHQKAWDILSKLPKGRMNEYINNAIITADNRDHIKDMMVETMLEIMDNYSFAKTQPRKTNKIDDEAMDFIKNL